MQSVQDFGNGAQSGAAVLAGTQNAVSSVLGLRTPLLHQGDMTGFFFSFVHCLCYLWMLLFPVWGEYIHCLLQGELLYIFLRFCGSAFQVSPVFVTTQGNVLPPLCCGLLYNFFALALFFIGVATLFKNRLGLSLPRGLTRRVTWFNLSKIIYRWWVQHVGGVNAFLIYVLIIQKTATNPCEPNEG